MLKNLLALSAGRGSLESIMAFLNKHRLEPMIGASYAFDHIRDACIALDSHKVNGKIVVTME